MITYVASAEHCSPVRICRIVSSRKVLMITRAETVFALRAPRTPMHAPITETNGTAREILARSPQSPYAKTATGDESDPHVAFPASSQKFKSFVSKTLILQFPNSIPVLPGVKHMNI